MRIYKVGVGAMIFDEATKLWRVFQKHPVLRLAGAITAGLGTMFLVTFPKAPPLPSELTALLILVATVSLGFWWSLGQAWRLRKTVRFFRTSRGAPQSKG
jgi:glucose uptake protein GlcU